MSEPDICSVSDDYYRINNGQTLSLPLRRWFLKQIQIAGAGHGVLMHYTGDYSVAPASSLGP